jgi:hypothetical protein
MITFATPAGPAGTHRRATEAARWVVHVILAAQIALVGAGRLPECYRALADHLGAVGGSLWLHLAGGTLEPAGAIGLAAPCVVAAAALAILGAVVAASLAHLIGLLAWTHLPVGRGR